MSVIYAKAYQNVKRKCIYLRPSPPGSAYPTEHRSDELDEVQRAGDNPLREQLVGAKSASVGKQDSQSRKLSIVGYRQRAQTLLIIAYLPIERTVFGTSSFLGGIVPLQIARIGVSNPTSLPCFALPRISVQCHCARQLRRRSIAARCVLFSFVAVSTYFAQ